MRGSHMYSTSGPLNTSVLGRRFVRMRGSHMYSTNGPLNTSVLGRRFVS